MGYKSIPELVPKFLSSIRERVGNNLKSSDLPQNLKLRDRARDNYKSHIYNKGKRKK